MSIILLSFYSVTYICYIVHTSGYQQNIVTLQQLLGLTQTVWPQSKSCSCYFEILMRIQRHLGSAAVNVFDTKIEMPPLHESVSRSVAARYIKMTFSIQQAENKPLKPPPTKNFWLSRNFSQASRNLWLSRLTSQIISHACSTLATASRV